jgi:hypothetical protein
MGPLVQIFPLPADTDATCSRGLPKHLADRAVVYWLLLSYQLFKNMRIVCLLINVFAMSECVNYRASSGFRLSSGGRGAAAAIQLGEDPYRFLSTIQIGIT